MPGGSGSTLIINPRGLSSSTMSLDATGTYIVPLQTLDLNEEQRHKVVYDQAPPGEGGFAAGWYGPLVPVTFRVVIKAATRAAMIEAYNDLHRACINAKGGTIQYKPENLEVGVLTTYYHYVRSSPPRLIDNPKNRWDAETRSDQAYTLEVQMELMTHPVATSDPDTPQTISTLTTTLQNWKVGGSTNQALVQASDLKGSMPALLRILAQPGAGQQLGRLIMYRHSEGTLANFVSIYEAEDATAINYVNSWTEVADALRGNGAYMRCALFEQGNNIPQGLRFTINNPTDHEGRFAVFGVGFDDAGTVGTWTHQVKVKVGNNIQEGEDGYYADELNSWVLIYGGEFELPAMPLSDSVSGYDEGPYIEWYATRGSGTSEFWLDAIILVYVGNTEQEGTALDVSCYDEGGVQDTEELLVENFPDDYGSIRELAQVVAQSDGDLKRAPARAPRGDFLTLDPTRDHLLVFVQEQIAGAEHVVHDDDFTGYAANRWLGLADFEDLSDWTLSNASQSTSYPCEGDKTLKLTGSVEANAYVDDLELDMTMNEVFWGTDYVAVVIYCDGAPSAGSMEIRFCTDADNYYYWPIAFGDLSDGWNLLYEQRGNLTPYDAPDWADITRIQCFHSSVFNTNVYLDWLRAEHKDPDNGSVPNVTYDQFNFQPNGGAWTITDDDPDSGLEIDDSLACLDEESGIEKIALLDKTTPDNCRFSALVFNRENGTGQVGIVFRSGQDSLTEGAEDCYAFVYQVSNSTLYLYKYEGGSATELYSGSIGTLYLDTWYWMGVIVKTDRIKLYFVQPVYPISITGAEYIFSTPLRATIIDSTYSTGQCGLMSKGTQARFDEVRLTGLANKMVPGDEIVLNGKAIFRTIAPFAE